MTAKPLKISRDILKVDYISRERIKYLIDLIPSIRDKTLFTLMYYYGLRRIEASEMRLEDISFKNDQIFIGAAKKGVSGYYHLLASIKPLLGEYLKWRSEQGRRSEFLFFSRQNDRLSTNRIAALFKRAAKKARLPLKHQHAHVLRHSIAIHMASSGVNASTVQMHLRHKNLNNTMIYFKIIPTARAAQQKEAFDKMLSLD